MHFAIVVKKDPATGEHYAPFDADVAPEHRRLMIGHLTEGGHELFHETGPDGASRVWLLKGPLSRGGMAKPTPKL